MTLIDGAMCATMKEESMVCNFYDSRKENIKYVTTKVHNNMLLWILIAFNIHRNAYFLVIFGDLGLTTQIQRL